jgi:shikimate dehydrogenase
MTPTLCGVLGHPVGHSRSPALQNAAFEAAGLDWRYVKLPVPPELFDETVRALPGSGYRGANVTIPHKLAALRLADDATPAARAIGAANTLTFAGDGAIAADNTDAGGLLDALARPVAGLRALVLGAGGAGRAAVYALRGAGAAEVMLWNRTPERATAAAHELGAAAVKHPGPADLLVNATSVGLDPAVSDDDALAQLGLTGAAPYPVVVDLVYRDAGPTPVQAWAQVAGSAVVDGLEVLVRQGARSFEAWTGSAAPVDIMRAAARKTSAGT